LAAAVERQEEVEEEVVQRGYGWWLLTLNIEQG
jgi:hypothetical protein